MLGEQARGWSAMVGGDDSERHVDSFEKVELPVAQALGLKYKSTTDVHLSALVRKG